MLDPTDADGLNVPLGIPRVGRDEATPAPAPVAELLGKLGCFEEIEIGVRAPDMLVRDGGRIPLAANASLSPYLLPTLARLDGLAAKFGPAPTAGAVLIATGVCMSERLGALNRDWAVDDVDIRLALGVPLDVRLVLPTPSASQSLLATLPVALPVSLARR